jgi:hypothetical protein
MNESVAKHFLKETNLFYRILKCLINSKILLESFFKEWSVNILK